MRDNKGSMKVLYVTHYSGWGGANKALLQMILWLRRKYGVEALVLLPSKGPFLSELRSADIKYEYVPFSSWRGDYKGFTKITKAIKFTLRSFFMSIVMVLRYRRCNFDIIHGNSSLTGFSFFLAKAMRKPLVWHQREFGEDDYPMKYFYGRGLSGKILGASDVVVAISDAIGNYYRTFVRPESKIVRIYDGVDFNDLNNNGLQELAASIDENEFNVCMVGGVCDGKNQLEVLKALAILKQQDKLADMKFHIIGGDRTEVGYGKVLSDFIRDNGLDDYVVFHGMQRNVDVFYKKMDVSICASKGEGFGLVVVEAMMCGVPVIVNNSGALPELVKDGEHGYVYHINKPRELAEAILKVREGKLGSDVKERVRSYALANFSAERNADNIYSLYNKVLSDRCLKR